MLCAWPRIKPYSRDAIVTVGLIRGPQHHSVLAPFPSALVRPPCLRPSIQGAANWTAFRLLKSPLLHALRLHVILAVVRQLAHTKRINLRRQRQVEPDGSGGIHWNLTKPDPIFHCGPCRGEVSAYRDLEVRLLVGGERNMIKFNLPDKAHL